MAPSPRPPASCAFKLPPSPVSDDTRRAQRHWHVLGPHVTTLRCKHPPCHPAGADAQAYRAAPSGHEATMLLVGSLVPCPELPGMQRDFSLLFKSVRVDKAHAQSGVGGSGFLSLRLSRTALRPAIVASARLANCTQQRTSGSAYDHCCRLSDLTRALPGRLSRWKQGSLSRPSPLALVRGGSRRALRPTRPPPVSLHCCRASHTARAARAAGTARPS